MGRGPSPPAIPPGAAAVTHRSLSRRAATLALLAASAFAPTPPTEARVAEDNFDGARGWINSQPFKFTSLKGKVVLLDFWTYCCINCHHVLPDLAKLEAKYKDGLAVVGVHTAKFEAERPTENIRKKVREYQIKHPVINDADQVIWNRLGVNSWPTLVVFDVDGKYVDQVSGEGNYEVLDRVIGQLIAKAKAARTLDESPLTFYAESDKPHDEALYFPGKVLADAPGDRLFVADTDHNRIVVADLKGKLKAVIGNGQQGKADGGFEVATFNRPQGMGLFEGRLYVADTENHMIRRVDLDAKTVSTMAGTGVQTHTRSTMMTKARETALNSPWDVLALPGTRQIAVAMAGPHQIWKLDLDAETIGVWAGSGVENIVDGTLTGAAFAQPSGLATDGAHLFVADSEVSGIRSITLDPKNQRVETVVGVGLFGFGDVDGRASVVRLQHCLGVAFAGDSLYIADTYNNKIKVCDPKTKAVRGLVGTGKPGTGDEPAQFYQPGGLSVAGESLYVADTNNHQIRVVDLKDNKVSTLPIAGLTPPAPPRRKPTFPNAVALAAPASKVAPGASFALKVSLPLTTGFHMNEEAPVRYLLEGPPGVLGAAVSPTGQTLKVTGPDFEIPVPLATPPKAGESLSLRLSVQAFVCKDAYCTIKNFLYTVPITFDAAGSPTASLAGSTPAPR